MSLIYPGDFSQGDYTIRETVASGATAAQSFGPYRLPNRAGGQTAEVITILISPQTAGAAFSFDVELKTAAALGDTPIRIGDTETLTEAGGVQAVYCGGDYIQVDITINTAPASAVDVILKAKAR